MITRTRQWLANRTTGSRWATTLAVVLLLALVLGWTAWDRTQAEDKAQQTEQKLQLAEDNAREIAGQVRDACQRQGEVARLLGDICRQAEEVAEQPAEQVLVPPSDEQLRPLVQQYVAEWLERNPPRDGRDGVTPSVETISRLIAAELAENPPQDGEDGEDGRTPTAAELQPIVAAAVEVFLEANPPPPGEDGQDGEDGEDGADSTVPGPPGEPPLEWTFTTQDAVGRETTHRCVREDPFDPDAPRYECEPVEE